MQDLIPDAISGKALNELSESESEPKAHRGGGGREGAAAELSEPREEGEGEGAVSRQRSSQSRGSCTRATSGKKCERRATAWGRKCGAWRQMDGEKEELGFHNIYM